MAASLGWMPPAGAQAPRAGVDLKHGMTLEEVEKLPRKTATHGAQKQWQLGRGQLRGRALARRVAVDLRLGPERTLHVVFAAKTLEQWYLNRWEWSTY